MADSSGKIDVGNFLPFSDDLVLMLKEETDPNTLSHCLDHSKALLASCDNEFNGSRSLLQDHQRKIDQCRHKTEKAMLEIPTDDELDLLQKELEIELEKERLLMEQLRVMNNDITDLERQRTSVEEQKQTLKKQELEELRAQRKLSMYAAVTTIIPDLYDQSKISGHIVDRGQRKVEKFEFDPKKESTFDTCQSIWKMIDRS